MNSRPNLAQPSIEGRLSWFMIHLQGDTVHRNKRVIRANIDYTDPSITLTIDWRHLTDPATTYRICICQTHPGFSVARFPTSDADGEIDDDSLIFDFPNDTDLEKI